MRTQAAPPPHRPRRAHGTDGAAGTPRRGVRVERHALGPRLYLCGLRVHEFAVGFALMTVSAGLGLGDRGLPLHLGGLSAVAGGWLVVKDWNDLVPSRRDTTRWTLALHRQPFPLREWRRASWLPPLLAALTAAAGVGTVASSLAPGALARSSVLSNLTAPILSVQANVLTFPFGVFLVALALPIARRRQRAWVVAVILLALLGVLDALRGSAPEEATAVWGLAGLTTLARPAFVVDADRRTLTSALCVGLPIAGLAYAAAVASAWAAGRTARPAMTPDRALTEAADMLVLARGPVIFTGDMRWLPGAVGAVGVLGVLGVAWVIARPLRAALRRPDQSMLARGLEIIRASGGDTLSFFKLRRDSSFLFDADLRAFLTYRVAAGVMLVSGDPVGPPAALPGMIREAAALSERHGLKLAVLGAGPGLADVYRGAGLRRLYLGDEAIVETASFTLVGRQMRKVRQSVTRLERAGFDVELRRLCELGESTIAALHEVSAAWRRGAPETGFSMALDGLGGAHQADTVALIARDDAGAVRGFLHFVPCFGRSAVSLAAMRRDRDTPNGLTEYMVARAVELFRARGIEEVSLNFVSFGRWLRAPTNTTERALGLALSRLSDRFQIESLHRFNVKFLPRWDPRALWYQGTLGLPRAGLAALWAEGQLPRIPLGSLIRPERPGQSAAHGEQRDGPVAGGRCDDPTDVRPGGLPCIASVQPDPPPAAGERTGLGEDMRESPSGVVAPVISERPPEGDDPQ